MTRDATIILVGVSVILSVIGAILVVIKRMETEEHYQDEKFLNSGK